MDLGSGFCPVENGRLYYEYKGRGRAITFCNGSAMDRRIWDEQFDVFSESYHALRFDNLGCGKSSNILDIPHRYDEDLLRLHDFLGISASVVGGLSVGGGIALNYCLNFPERVSALILMGTFLTGYHWPHMTPQLMALAEYWKTGDIDRAVSAWNSMDWFAHMKTKKDKYQAVFEMVEENARRMVTAPFPPKEDWGTPMVNRLERVSVPVLLLVGEFDTPDNHEVMRIIKERISHARLVVIPDSGHAVNVENASCVNQAIIDFLDGEPSITKFEK